LRLRRQKHAKDFILQHELLIQDPACYRGKWNEIFSQGPIYLEIGMGKGRFLADCALRFPENNYIGLEVIEEMIMIAMKRLKDQQPANLRYLWTNANNLSEIFAPGEVKEIFLNFSDPWPKKKHHKRRLTATSFLDIYRQILPPEGQIHYKTDDRDFYFWSLEKFAEAGWNILTKSESLELKPDEVMTEYEERFRAKGQPIYFCRVAKS
jgi:tRNA (guanine-N7-)-methyltransferase